jgi:hypothetical protein
MLDTADWVAQTQAALLEDDPAEKAILTAEIPQPAAESDPAENDPPAIPFRVACRPEYQRRLLAVYVACAGWSRAQLAPVWALIEAADAAYLAEDAAGWLAALDELEACVGVTA